MRFAVALGCKACLSRSQVVVEGEPCPSGGEHAHIPITGIVEQWGAAHHLPGIVVLGPIPEET